MPPKKPSASDSKLQALVAAPVLATVDHNGFAEEAFAWGSRWLVAIALDGASKYSEGTWAFALVDATGRETSRTVLEKTTLAKILLANDELVLILGEPPALKVEVYRQAPKGSLERVASRPADAAIQHLWKCEPPMIAIGEGLVLVQDRDAHALVIYRHAPGFALEEVSTTQIEIGEKSKFIENAGFGGVAIAGSRALLSGPSQKTGYQLLDLADPTQPRPVATVKTLGPILQQIVAFVGSDQMLAYGSGGQALFLDHAAGKLTAQKVIKVGQTFGGMYRERDECLLYNGNLRRQTGFGVAPGKEIGKLTLPVDAVSISSIGDHVLFTGSERSVIVRRP